MAVNQVGKKRRSKSFKNCPRTILKVVPDNCTKVTFADLIPHEDYEHKAIIGKINHLYPIGKRRDGYIRKVLITDALSDAAENNEKKLTVFLLDQFARESETSEVEGFIVMTNFIVENVTHPKTSDWPVQILVKKDESDVWFVRKRNEQEKRKSATSKRKNKESDEEEAQVVTTHLYEYTKLGDLVEGDGKESYNVYGIVDKCDLKTTQRQRLDLLLTDQTETGFSCSIFAEVGETFPDVYKGDIVRIHRMQVHKFRGKLKGRCSNPKFILVFSKNNEVDKPRTVAKTFTFTPEDIGRFRELFEWNKKKSEPKLICEIKKDDFANIICQVIGVYIARSTEAVILKIWDGTKTNEFPGSHYGMQEEKLDQTLFTIARNYYVVLSVYGDYIAAAAELQPGQYIEVCNAHCYSTKNNPEECKLCIHAGSKEGRGIEVLNESDERVMQLKERLEKVISSTLEFGNQTEDPLSQDNSIFLNCDISVFASTQNAVNGEKPAPSNILNKDSVHPDEGSVHPSNEDSVHPSKEDSVHPSNEDSVHPSNEDSVHPSNEDSVHPEAEQNENDIILLNEPLANMDVLNNDISSHNEPQVEEDTPVQNAVVSVIDASIKPGQSTQEFGLGMPRDVPNVSDDENRMSVTSEPDPICNLTPLQTRYFFHDPQRSASQMTDSIFPTYVNATQDEWWSSIPAVSVTDQHSDIKPITLAEVVQHSVPHKFRVLAAVFCFKPNTNSIRNFIHLWCPKCPYLSEEAFPSLEPIETRDGLSYYYCPVCSDKEDDQAQWPVLEYTFLVSLSLHDGSGPPVVEAYIWKENAVKFFKGITPEEALKDSATADSILHMLWSICPNCRPFNSSRNEQSSVYPILDCCILSYSAGSGTRYQMFDTILV